MENVVKFPNELTNLFKDAHRAIAMGAESKQKFVEGKLLLSASLAAIRERFDDNEAFGKACSEHGLGENIVSKNERSILIQWAERPEWTRTVLEKTERTSIRMIHAREWIDQSLPSAGKSPANQKPPGGKAFEPIADFIRAEEARTGELPRENDITRATGASSGTVHTVSAVFRALRADADSTAPLRFTKAQEHHVEMRVKTEVKSAIEQLNASFEIEVQKRNKADIDKLFPDLEEMRKKAATNERYFREQMEKHAIFTEAEYRDLLLCTHESNPSDETRKRAFMALSAKRLQLTGKR